MPRMGRGTARRGRAIGVMAVAFLACATAAGKAPPTGEVRGKIELELDGLDPARLGPMVVCLEGIGKPVPFEVPGKRGKLSQRDATFKPAFQVVTVGQPIDLPNDDTIFHSVFSCSRPNDFAFEPYPRGDSRTIAFSHPGVVRIYCSIHESMNATVYVAPTPYHCIAGRRQEFTITGVPPGRYRLFAWNEMVPFESREIEVRADGVTEANLKMKKG